MRGRCISVGSSWAALEGFRGSIGLGPGLNIVLGPNNSGKTALLEAILAASAVTLVDPAEGLQRILLVSASKGSIPHALAGLTPEGSARPCIRLGGREVCVRVLYREKVEVHGIELSGILELFLKEEGGGCESRFAFMTPSGIQISIKDRPCYGRPSPLQPV